MAEPQRPASLSDLLNYKPEQYLSEGELSLIQSTFRNNPKLIAVLRKIFVPTIADPDLPIEQMGDDTFGAGYQWQQIPADEVKILVVARQDAIKFIMGGLIKLKIIASSSDENPMEAALRRSKDSTK